MLIWAFIRLTRPLFLLGGVLLYLVGALIAIREGVALNLARLLTGQLLITSIQLMTHYTNEYYDQEGDRLNENRTWFSGGSGVLAAGQLSARTARKAMLLMAVFAGLSLIAAGWQSPRVLVPGVLGLLAAWSYSGPPLTLARTGLGEAAASLVVALLVPVVGYVMQAGRLDSPILWITCLPFVLIHFAMLIAFQIPDQAADKATGKYTLAVRLGEQRAVRLHNLSLFIAFCVILGLTFYHWPGAQLVLLCLPLAIWQAFYLLRALSRPPEHFTWLTIGAVALLGLSSALWLLGLVLL